MKAGLNVGSAHRIALLSTVALPTFGVMSGSLRLWIGGFLLLVATLVSAPFLRRPERSRRLQLFVHGTTAVVLAWALASLQTARIDSVLIIVMLGIFNRVTLRRGARDDFIIVASAAVLMTMATTITPGVAFLPLVMAFVPAVLWTLLTSTILGEARDPRSVERFAGEPLPRLKAALGLTGIVFMLLGYVGVSAFPRYNFSRMFSVGAFASFAGADRSMRLGVGGLDTEGDGTVMIRVTPPPDVDPSTLTDRYARVFALDRFDGQTWEASEPWPGRSITAKGLRPDERWSRVRVRRLVPRSEPHPVVLFGRDAPAPVSLRAPTESPGGTWYSGIPQASLRFEYSVDLSQRARLPAPPDLSPFLQLPEGWSPRIRRLAVELAGGATDFEARSRAISRHFEDGYRYSLEPLEGAASDPLERFVFEAKQGHCELYAGAMAAMLRAVGIPARVVTGYYGGWWNAAARQLEFVGEDAHAWVEAYDPDRGWVWLDATPPDLRTVRRGKSWAWIRDLYDWAEGLWYTYVVDYDEKRRRRMLDGVRSLVRGSWESWTDASSVPSSSQPVGAFVVWVPMALAFLGGGLFWARRGRDELRLGRRLRKALKAPPSTTLRRALSDLPTDLQPTALQAVTLYEALRFSAPSQRPAFGAVREAVRALERAARRVW